MKAIFKSPFLQGVLVVVVATAIWLAIEARQRRQQQPATAWQTAVTDDGRASIEMPGTPQKKAADASRGDDGQLIVHFKNLNQEFRLVWGTLPDLPAGMTASQALGLTPVGYLNELQKRAPHAVELLGHKLIDLDGYPGIEIEYRFGGRVLISRTYYAHGSSYAAEAVVPEAAKGAPSVKRFFDSFKIKPPGMP